jgi:alkylated DNA repair dioxygenase AlkB
MNNSKCYPPNVTGVSCSGAFVVPDEEQSLIASIDAAGLTPFRFHGWIGKRLTASYGWHYDFADADFAPAAPIPDWLLPLRDRAARFVYLQPDELAQVMLIRYEPGAGIGWHRDHRVFGDILGVSLGAPAMLRFRRLRPGAGGYDRASLSLPPRSIYHGESQVRTRL